ncbi:putative S-phase kinase-associated protein [Rosa chinensis]|uniref:SKP1-like protein n=1 Tax=Rosa chinensis TaxID=74649 RepID=A0A2P6Q8A9_ROSCH|nr:SKP1-like protein 4 [Rosa chinensis]PRQ30397.1 putative S-phase kinase-associated protein [Rosa chinensis]
MLIATEEKKISVRTSDGQEFELEENLAMESAIIKTSLDAFSRDDIILLPNVNSWEMVKIIEFFTKVQELETKFGVKFMEKKEGRFLEAFQAEFDKDLSDDNLRCLLWTVDYLGIEVLLENLCHLMAERTKNKTVESCRNLFGVQHDYTPEEEAEIREDYSWAFEGPEIEE